MLYLFETICLGSFDLLIYLISLSMDVQGVLDITTTEVADYIVGGVMACDSNRFDVILEKNVPLVLSIGALDMVNFGAKHRIPSVFQQRNIHVHNEEV